VFTHYDISKVAVDRILADGEWGISASGSP
jgi:hypothetical protein